MAIKTFTANSVLTAADTNTYLANSGLVYVTSQTVGSGVASVTVSSAFSATYDNYLITLVGGSMSADTALGCKLGSTSTGYYGSYIYSLYSLTVPVSAGDNNGSQFTYVGGGNAAGAAANFTLLGPNLAKRTYVNANVVFYGTQSGTYSGLETSATQHTAFTVAPFSGTISNGTITVYGYRKA
jgi:hypothetical protein